MRSLLKGGSIPLSHGSPLILWRAATKQYGQQVLPEARTQAQREVVGSNPALPSMGHMFKCGLGARLPQKYDREGSKCCIC